jgi:hypothetical protein
MFIYQITFFAWGLWVSKDAEFYVDFKNIAYLSEKCTYQKLLQNN